MLHQDIFGGWPEAFDCLPGPLPWLTKSGPNATSRRCTSLGMRLSTSAKTRLFPEGKLEGSWDQTALLDSSIASARDCLEKLTRAGELLAELVEKSRSAGAAIRSAVHKGAGWDRVDLFRDCVSAGLDEVVVLRLCRCAQMSAPH